MVTKSLLSVRTLTRYIFFECLPFQLFFFLNSQYTFYLPFLLKVIKCTCPRPSAYPVRDGVAWYSTERGYCGTMCVMGIQ
jgi:hypothetical protein